MRRPGLELGESPGNAVRDRIGYDDPHPNESPEECELHPAHCFLYSKKESDEQVKRVGLHGFDVRHLAFRRTPSPKNLRCVANAQESSGGVIWENGKINGVEIQEAERVIHDKMARTLVGKITFFDRRAATNGSVC